MPSVARIGDPTSSGTCPAGHPQNPIAATATITSGSGTVFVNGASIARLGDNTVGTAGWAAPISSGSGNVIAN